MSAARRKPSYNYGFDAGSSTNHGHPNTLYPPEGYCLLERDLHRATTSLQVRAVPILLAVLYTGSTLAVANGVMWTAFVGWNMYCFDHVRCIV